MQEERRTAVSFLKFSTRGMISSTAINEMISAAGAEYSGPVTPIYPGKSSTSGTLITKSRSRESPMERNGLPRACKKMLVDFWMQHSRIVLRKIR